jgi:hypothetical protein
MIHNRGFILMLITTRQITPASQNDDESGALRCGIAELNRNTVLLITQAEKLVEESKQLLERIKSFENRNFRPNRTTPTPH